MVVERVKKKRIRMGEEKHGVTLFLSYIAVGTEPATLCFFNFDSSCAVDCCNVEVSLCG